jgi:dihydrofolate synthase / folylpolyglutamate synthase
MSHPADNRATARHEAALRYLAGRIDYERTHSMPNSEEALKLDRMRELLHRLDNPQQGMPIIHVAGTKGKGSTAAAIAGVLSAAGYRTGLFTSPHLDRVEERIAIDGRPCTSEELATLVDIVTPAVELMDRAAAQRQPPEQGPTYFEILTAIAFCHFARSLVDAAVLEVGLGGRLDSTNVCTPCLSVITSISFDHTQQLGNTLEAIAAEKAGIIKPGVTVVSGLRDDPPRDVIRRIAAENGCRLVELGGDFDFDYEPPRHLELGPSLGQLHYRYTKPRRVVAPVAKPQAAGTTTGRGFMLGATTGRGFITGDFALRLLGRHQAANAAVALAALQELQQTGWNIPEAAIRRGLAELAWPARIEVVARRPTVVLDAAHNVASIEALLEVLDESFAANRRLLVFGTTLEKDVSGMLERLLGRFDHVIFTRYLHNPRAVPIEQLQTLAAEISCRNTPCAVAQWNSQAPSEAATPGDAWATVHRLAKPDDLVCITGSFFLAAEMRREIAARP